MLSQVISDEELHFIEGRNIHDAVGETQETLHNINNISSPAMILKLDLSKVYDRVSYTLLHLMILQIGFSLQMVRWIVGCVTSLHMPVLIYGPISFFFNTSQELHQGLH